MNSEVCNGDHRYFTLETYYNIMLKGFNDLSESVYVHTLNYTKKINAFEQILKDLQEIHWCIILKECWDNFPPAEQTFDIFYNEISKYIGKYKNISPGSIRSSCIGAFNTKG